MSPPKATRETAVGSWLADGLLTASKKGGLAVVCVVAGLWMTHEAGSWAGPNVIKPGFDDFRAWQRDIVTLGVDATKTNGRLVDLLERQDEDRRQQRLEDKRRDTYMEQVNITLQGIAKTLEHLQKQEQGRN